MYWYTRITLYRCPDVLEYRCTGVPVYLCTGVLVHQCIDVPVYQCTGVPVYWRGGQGRGVRVTGGGREILSLKGGGRGAKFSRLTAHAAHRKTTGIKNTLAHRHGARN